MLLWNLFKTYNLSITNLISLNIIPKSLGNLTSLEYLNVSHNDDDIIDIPESLINLEERRLKILL